MTTLMSDHTEKHKSNSRTRTWECVHLLEYKLFSFLPLVTNEVLFVGGL